MVEAAAAAAASHGAAKRFAGLLWQRGRLLLALLVASLLVVVGGSLVLVLLCNNRAAYLSTASLSDRYGTELSNADLRWLDRIAAPTGESKFAEEGKRRLEANLIDTQNEDKAIRRRQNPPNGNSADANSRGSSKSSKQEPARSLSRNRRHRGAETNEKAKPILNEFSFPANLVQGMRFVLMCQVLDGEPPVQIKWFKDNLDLADTLATSAAAASRSDSGGEQPGQPNRHLDEVEIISSDELGASLLFRRVKQSHAGNYTCVASNHFGSASYSSFMNVKVPPTWRVEPRDQSTTLGEQITIDCQAVGNPNPFIRWKFANARLAPPTTRAPLAHRQGEPPPQQPVGSPQQLANFRLLNSNHHVQTLENGSLTIRQAGREHAGSYACEADNGVAPSSLKVVRLIVHEQAHFQDEIEARYQDSAGGKLVVAPSSGGLLSAPTSAQVVGGGGSPVKIVRLAHNTSVVRLACSPFGEPPLQLDWLKDGRLVHAHSVGQREPEEAAAGSTQEQVQAAGSAANSQVTLVARYHVNTRWAAQPLNGGAQGLESELVIVNLARQDAGLFSCAARNAFGQAERKLQLVVQEPPEPPALVDVAHISSRSIALRWLAPFDGNSPIVKYIVEYRAQPDGPTAAASNGGGGPSGRSEKLMAPGNALLETAGGGLFATESSNPQKQIAADQQQQVQHSVHELEPLTRYSMRVVAVNALGQSRPSVALSLRTEEEVPATVPSLVQAAVLSSKSVKLQWTISYPAEHELIDGFFIGYRSFDTSVLLAREQPQLATLSGATPSMSSSSPSSGASVASAAKHSPSSASAGDDERPTFTYKTIRLTNQQRAHDYSLAGSADQQQQQQSAAVAGQLPFLAPVSSVTKTLERPQQNAAAVSNRHLAIVTSNFEHVISGLERNTEYTILIQCFNKKGAGPASDPVVFRTFANDPPEKLVLVADEISESSARLSWHFVGSAELSQLSRLPVQEQLDLRGGGVGPSNPVDGFLLSYAKMLPPRQVKQLATSSPTAAAITSTVDRSLSATGQHQVELLDRSASPAARVSSQSGERQAASDGHLQWQALQLAPQQRQHTLKNLDCGSWYAMRIYAFNRIGKGEPSDTLTFTTRGKAPVAPDKRSFLNINSTQVRLHLSAWYDGGCDIEKFVVQYRGRAGTPTQLDWILVSNNIIREQSSVLIRDLAPATAYELLVSAHNRVGVTETKYRFHTLDADGKQVVSPSHSGFLGSASLNLDDDDDNMVVDYVDESGTRREVWHGFANGGGPTASKWPLLVRQTLNSPLTLLIALCLFVVLLVVHVFHRFNGSQSGGLNSLSGTLRSSPTSSSATKKFSSANSGSSGAASSHGHTIYSGVDTSATILDGEPPMSLANGSPLLDSPAHVNLAGNGGGVGRIQDNPYVPGDCYGQLAYCNGGGSSGPGGLPIPQLSQPNIDSAYHIDGGATTAISDPGSGNFLIDCSRAVSGQQQNFYGSTSNYASVQRSATLDASLNGAQLSHHPAAVVAAAASNSNRRQQCIMQMLMMSPQQQQQQIYAEHHNMPSLHHVSESTGTSNYNMAAALSTMARQKGGPSKQANFNHFASSSMGGGDSMTLGRQFVVDSKLI